MHLDFSTDDVEAEVARLVELGATETGRNSFGDFGWVVLADPEGNAFCVAPRASMPLPIERASPTTLLSSMADADTFFQPSGERSRIRERALRSPPRSGAT